MTNAEVLHLVYKQILAHQELLEHVGYEYSSRTHHQIELELDDLEKELTMLGVEL